jgi:hypothetical protein
MASMDELRAGVRRCLPEVNNIKDEDLRNKVIEAWAFSLAQSEFASIDDMKSSGGPNTPGIKNGKQSDHLRGVAWIAQGIADGLERSTETSALTGISCGPAPCVMTWANRSNSAPRTRRDGRPRSAPPAIRQFVTQCTACMWR